MNMKGDKNMDGIFKELATRAKSTQGYTRAAKANNRNRNIRQPTTIESATFSDQNAINLNVQMFNSI